MKIKSLSSQIVFIISIVALTSIFIISYIFEKINQQAFYNVETQKAELVLETIEPLIAVNMYLNLKSGVDNLISQLITNPDILSVKVIQNDKILTQRESEDIEKDIENSFIVKTPIFQPNSKKKIGELILVYSNKNYKKLVDKHTKFLMQILVLFGIFTMVLSLYIKKLLLPLREISKLLKSYSPDKNIDIPFNNQSNEIGYISKALNNMQQSIYAYSEQQKNINKYLEEKIDEKTLELRKQLYTNSLTGLPNRLSLLKDIDSHKDGSLLIINIDDFKEINDFFGQATGDSLLIKFSNKLSSIIKKDKNIILIHLFGDEFALFFIKKPSKDQFIEYANNLIKEIEKTIFYDQNNELSVRITIGATYQVKEALEKADIALKSAKKSSKEFLLYDESLNVELQYKNNMEWSKKINWAIENDRIHPYFQPIYDNKTNKIVSAECLIRLIDKEENIITPYHFLSIAKKGKLYPKLTKIIVQKSCEYFENIDCDFSINLSVEDILDKDIVDFISSSIKKYNVSKKIIFEILETEEIENYEEISSFINEMKSFGCRVAIDDFGSGYSNFEYILQLNIDYIKIDGSLIKNIDKDKNAQIVVETIVSFAKRLDILVVAEFVHNNDVYQKVKELEIDRSQGFFLSEPKDSLILD